MIRVFLKGNVLLMLLNFATSITTARAIGPDGRGIVAMVIVWPAMLLYWLNCNLPPSMSYFLPRLTPETRRSFVGTVFGFAFLVGLISTLILEGIAPRIFREEAVRYLPEIRLILLWTPMAAVTEMGTNILLGLQDNKFWTYVRIVQPIVLGMGALAALVGHGFFHLTVRSVLALNVAGWAVMSVLVLVRVAQICGIGRPGAFGEFRAAMIYSLKSHSTSVAGSLNQSLDQLLLGTFVGPTALGVYSTAVNFTNLLSPITSAATVGIVPHLSALEPEARRPAPLSRRAKRPCCCLWEALVWRLPCRLFQ